MYYSLNNSSGMGGGRKRDKGHGKGILFYKQQLCAMLDAIQMCFHLILIITVK